MKEHTIVLGMDGSDGAARAMEWTIPIARALDAEVIALYVFEFPVFPVAPLAIPAVLEDEDLRKATQVALEGEWCRPLQEAKVTYHPRLVDGSPAHMLDTIAVSEGATMIVVGARGRGGFRELLLGSVGHSLTHHARVPVVIVPPVRD